jgi:hypothetical protein
MVVVAPILENTGVDFDREDLDMVEAPDGDVLTTEGVSGDEVICERCETTIAKDFGWDSVSNLYTECPECDGTVLLGGL